MTPRNTVDDKVNIHLEVLLSELETTTRDLQVLVHERKQSTEDDRNG